MSKWFKKIQFVLFQFYTKIINAFIESWFSLLSKNADFVQALKFNFREATCRLVIKLKGVGYYHFHSYRDSFDFLFDLHSS